MEFLEMAMVLVAVILMIKKPEKENLAFGLTMASWAIMAILYLGSKSGSLLTIMNL